ncbi:copper chaperone PCu(A)C [Arhodomonas sp. AD133]|uniref:copper chaperone PCu(A)C n=1 Tax=Arhodomonas sp. AD133 TaxID=3415009 RepID=UPI003EBFAF77
MHRLLRSVLATATLTAVTAAAAHSFEAGALTIESPWARATPPGAPSAAVYFTVTSDGAADHLTGVSVDEAIAAHASLHRTVRENDTARMEPVDTAPVSAQRPLVFEPGGYHVMLTGLKKTLAEGDRFPITLEFAQAGDVDVEVTVEPLTGRTNDHAGKHH